jgi:uncharacterized membrane protein
MLGLLLMGIGLFTVVILALVVLAVSTSKHQRLNKKRAGALLVAGCVVFIVGAVSYTTGLF